MAEKRAVKRRLFASEYLIDKNATRAAERAGYSKKTAYSAGQRLLKHPEVQELINAGVSKVLKKNEVTVDRVVKGLARIAFADIRRLYDESGNLKAPADIPVGIAHAVAGIEVDEIWEGYGDQREQTGETKKVRLNDRVRALELLGRHLKMFSETLKIDFSDRLAERLEAARKRMNGK